MLSPLLALVAAYFIGAIPFGYFIVKWTTGADVRSSGSGNIGATNVLRTTGRTAGMVTLLRDCITRDIDHRQFFDVLEDRGSIWAGKCQQRSLRSQVTGKPTYRAECLSRTV